MPLRPPDQQIPSLREYVLASQRLPRLEHFHRDASGTWTLHSAEGSGTALVLPSLEITLELDEVYAGVEFAPAPFRPPVRPPA